MSSRRKLFLFVALPLVLIFVLLATYIAESGQSDGLARSKDCPAMVSPVDMSRVTSILYPGQERGGDYKAHGGFRLDNSPDNNVEVRAPYSAKITAAGRSIEMGETQIIMDLKTDCGLEYRFDHLRTLAPKFQSMLDELPAAKESSSNTHGVRPAISVTAGEVIATAVGFIKSPGGEAGPNVSFDLGLYDRRGKNQASQNPDWAAVHKQYSYQTFYAVCWLDWLPSIDAAIAKSLPAGDGKSGKTSDFCH